VNDSLRDTDSSTPYEFTIDTLQEDDGPVKVRFDAYNEKGQKGTVSLNLRVDNGTTRGVDFHLEKGREALAASKWDEAIVAGRVALKIDPASNPARLLLSRANFGKGVNDLAQKYLEDVLASEPKNEDALNLLAGIEIERAFTTFTTSGAQRTATIGLIDSALRRAAQTRASLLAERVDALGDGSGALDPARLRTLAAADRYNRIAQELSQKAQADPQNVVVQNWTIYGLMRAGRYQEALVLYRRYEKLGKPDLYGLTLGAVLKQFLGDEEGALAAEKEAVKLDPASPSLLVARTYLALRRGSQSQFSADADPKDRRENVLVRQRGAQAEFGNLTAELLKANDSSPITLYYLSTAQLQRGQFDESMANLKRALLAEPAFFEAYIERANQILLYTFNNRLSQEETTAQRALARAFFNAALGARPESFEALTGLSLMAGLEANMEECIRLGEAAIKAAPGYAPAHYTLAAAYSTVRAGLTTRAGREQNRDKRAALLQEQASWMGRARTAIDQASKVDPLNIRGRTIPPFDVAWRYYYVHGRTPLIPAP
jgi:tetratricopeptide (TPR) repeat protein